MKIKLNRTENFSEKLGTLVGTMIGYCVIIIFFIILYLAMGFGLLVSLNNLFDLEFSLTLKSLFSAGFLIFLFYFKITCYYFLNFNYSNQD